MLKFINVVGTLALAAIASTLPVNANDMVVRAAKGAALFDLGGVAFPEGYRSFSDGRLDAALYRLADARSMQQLAVWIAARDAAGDTQVATN